MQLERKHIYAIAGVASVLLIVIIVSISKSDSKVQPQPEPPKPVPTNVKRCDNSTSELKDFQVSNCADTKTTRCKLKRGSIYAFKLTFTNGDKYAKALSEIQLPGGAYGEDACELGLECPIKTANKVQTLKQTISIYSHMTPQSGDATMRVLDDKVAPIICVKFPVEVV